MQLPASVVVGFGSGVSFAQWPVEPAPVRPHCHYDVRHVFRRRFEQASLQRLRALAAVAFASDQYDRDQYGG